MNCCKNIKIQQIKKPFKIITLSKTKTFYFISNLSNSSRRTVPTKVNPGPPTIIVETPDASKISARLAPALTAWGTCKRVQNSHLNPTERAIAISIFVLTLSAPSLKAVSYTHLTLPTICSV